MDREFIRVTPEGHEVWLEGVVAVNTASLTLIDGANVGEFDLERDVEEPFLADEGRWVAPHTKSSCPSYALTVRTPLGDGFYPVYVEYGPDGPVRIVVNLRHQGY